MDSLAQSNTYKKPTIPRHPLKTQTLPAEHHEILVDYFPLTKGKVVLPVTFVWLKQVVASSYFNFWFRWKYQPTPYIRHSRNTLQLYTTPAPKPSSPLSILHLMLLSFGFVCCALLAVA